MYLIYFLIIGLVAGWLAGQIMKGKGFGLLGNLIVGCIGAVLGGYLFGWLGISTYGLIGSLVTALAGALVLLWIIRLIQKK
ncbi:GlsB/YeaQ/YmgE family stress response membrane protein [bacterium]|nr:GlsB/YeaQ/YmgE family stress response membrane protein [bacterium]RQV98960.1 MAG: GlsB/YeaQ/YmgE family stress response membrane protein [bacterium]